MTKDRDLHDEAEELREETAAEAPELAEHDRAAELEAQLEEANNKVLYAAAELQNARRRMDKELADTRAYAAAGFARDMLAVRDHLQRALDHVPEGARDGDLANFVGGIEATLRELDQVFQRNGVERIAAKGLPLDPNKHQAMIEIPTNEAEPGTVVEEMQAGYVLKDRLLRPALVGVAKAG
jgi:molecular chaperone GrpE